MEEENNLAKVSIVGSGNVGATCAFSLAISGKSNVYLFDKFEDLAKAKALDIGQAAVAYGSQSKIVAAKSLADLKDSKVIIITAGFARKPGMSREDLVKKNGAIVLDIAQNIKRYASKAIIIQVSNPLDVLTYLMLKETGFARNKVFGMAGIVDNSRFRYFAANKTGVESSKIQSHILGLHANQMIIPEELISIDDKPIKKVINQALIDELKANTRQAGAQIVGLLKNGSAFYMPGTGAFLMTKAVIDDENKLFNASVYLEGEYGVEDACLGVPVIIGKAGIKEVKEMSLNSKTVEELQKNKFIFKKQLEAAKAL